MQLRAIGWQSYRPVIVALALLGFVLTGSDSKQETVCPDCEGSGELSWIDGGRQRGTDADTMERLRTSANSKLDCLRCNGTGKVPLESGSTRGNRKLDPSPAGKDLNWLH